MVRKDGKAKATINSALKVSSSPSSVYVASSKKIIPNVNTK